MILNPIYFIIIIIIYINILLYYYIQGCIFICQTAESSTAPELDSFRLQDAFTLSNKSRILADTIDRVLSIQ